MQKTLRSIILWLLLAALLLSVPSGCGRRPDGAATVMDFAFSGTPTPAPAPTPTPAPAPVISFTESESSPLPTRRTRHVPGTAYALSGRVGSNYPLTAVTVTLTCSRNYGTDYPKTSLVRFHAYDGVYDYDLSDTNTLEGASLAALTDFSTLTPGLHTLTLTARSSAMAHPVTLAETEFYVLGEAWETIEQADFNGTYGSTSRFFQGDTEKFLYRYQWVYDRYVIADPDWEEKHIVSIDAYGGRPWLIHADAKPYYEEALAYLAAARVRVHGTNGDTGVLPLSDCILTYNGSYVSRFTSTLKTISHHAFGTATDINAALEPNKNLPVNSALIDKEVRDLLAYNGILTDEAGAQYYDFTYSGAYKTTSFGVPETVLNYLLYELAFYRAGFQWGHYYISTSDAMHFSLSDNIQMDHSGKKGLRKVRDYYMEAISMDEKKLTPEQIAKVLSGKAFEKEIEMYRSEGWSDEEIAEMFLTF